MARKRRKRHPMSAGQRHPNGTPYRPDEERCGPTPETEAKLKQGPTDVIDWYVHHGALTPSEGQAVSAFRALRAAAGVARRTPQTPLRGFIPGGGSSVPDDKQVQATARLKEIAGMMTGLEYAALVTVCQAQHLPEEAVDKADVRALKRAAAVCVSYFLRGERLTPSRKQCA